MDPKKTGTIISDARKNMNMTQKELADKLYVSDKAVSKWERGLCFPDISVLIPLTEILNISLYDLLRGERMKKSEVEETLKNTISYTNNELKRNKKKYTIISSIIILGVVILSVLSLIFISKNNDIGGIVDRDTIYDISYYSDYITSVESKDSEKIELIITKLPLSWKERTFVVEEDIIKINYDVSYNDVVKAYNDEHYVKNVMINNASILFTAVTDIEKVEIRFTDYRYTISKSKLLTVFNINKFEEVIEKEEWSKYITTKLIDDEFVNDTFKLFEKSKVSKDELENNPVSDR